MGRKQGGEQFGPPQKESFRRKKPKMGVLLYTVGAVVGIRLLRVGCSTTTTTMRTIALTIVQTTAVTTSRTIPLSGRACLGRFRFLVGGYLFHTRKSFANLRVKCTKETLLCTAFSSRWSNMSNVVSQMWHK